MLVKYHDYTLWITKYSTAGVIDDKCFGLEGVFQISGTKTYTTVLGGSNTILVAEPIDIKQFFEPITPVTSEEESKK